MKFVIVTGLSGSGKSEAMKALEDMGGKVEVRMGQAKDGPVITDNGNFILMLHLVK
mgnify:CR=1 FL=1